MDGELHRVVVFVRVSVMGVPLPCCIALPIRLRTTCQPVAVPLAS